MSPADVAGQVRAILDEAERAADALRERAELAAQRLQGVWGATPTPLRPPSDDELVRAVLADPKLREKVLALVNASPAPG